MTLAKRARQIRASRWAFWLSALFVVSLTSDSAAQAKNQWKLQPEDCAEFRGPLRDGVIHDVTIVPDWKERPPKLLWRKKAEPAWSGMIVVDSRLVTQEQRGESESVVCYDAATGNELWAHGDKARYDQSMAGVGPRGTPTFAEGQIYTLGARGLLNCLKPETGDVIWSHDIAKDAEIASADLPEWGYSVSPLVVDGLVIVFAGGTKGKSVIAYRASDGSIAWTRPAGKHSYSSPQVSTFHGRKQIVLHDTSAVRLLDVADGAERWRYATADDKALPMLQPHVTGTKIVVSTTPGMICVEVPAIGAANKPMLWESSKLQPEFADFVIHKDAIYGLNNGVLCRLDLNSGDVVWKKLRLGYGQILLLADQAALLVLNSNGELILVSVNREGPTELGRYQAIEGKTFNGPVLVGNRVYVRNTAEIAAYEINVQSTGREVPASELPAKPL